MPACSFTAAIDVSLHGSKYRQWQKAHNSNNIMSIIITQRTRRLGLTYIVIQILHIRTSGENYTHISGQINKRRTSGSEHHHEQARYMASHLYDVTMTSPIYDCQYYSSSISSTVRSAQRCTCIITQNGNRHFEIIRALPSVWVGSYWVKQF